MKFINEILSIISINQEGTKASLRWESHPPLVYTELSQGINC